MTERIEVDAAEQAAGAEWLERIEEENAGELTPSASPSSRPSAPAPTPGH